jgi:four helix bundle protein
MKTFEELDCWKRAAELRRNFSAIVKTFPAEEKFRLSDQILRASRSVTANIAEGYGRFHFQEYIQFCRQSRASLYELLDHLLVAFDEHYISEVQLRKLRTDVDGCLAVLNGFINYLKKAKNTGRSNGTSIVTEPKIEYYEFIND